MGLPKYGDAAMWRHFLSSRQSGLRVVAPNWRATRTSRTRQWFVFGVAIVLTASGLIFGPAPASAARDPRIVFQRDVNGASQIWLTNSKGTRTRPLTAKQVDSALPRWGPNGHRILYIRAARRGLNDTDLMVMGARGRHNRVLLPGQGRNIIDDLAWAPGGLRVVLVMTRLSADQDYVDDADLWVYTPRTRRLRKLNALPGRMVTSVDWSRAGIVFSAFDFYGEPRGKADLYAIRPNGSGLRQVTNTPTRHEERPRFSPDGLRLVYTAAAGRCRTLIVTNAGGRNPRRTGVGCNARGASWSPDSRRLLAQLRTRRQEMWDIRVDGSDKRFIAPGAQGSWRPR